jgi:hypothetical protein
MFCQFLAIRLPTKCFQKIVIKCFWFSDVSASYLQVEGWEIYLYWKKLYWITYILQNNCETLKLLQLSSLAWGSSFWNDMYYDRWLKKPNIIPDYIYIFFLISMMLVNRSMKFNEIYQGYVIHWSSFYVWVNT